MEIINTLITACGGGIVAGIFALISSAKQRKAEKNKEESEISKKLDAISEKLDNHIASDEAAKADDARIRILRFSDEVRRGEQYTEEHWSNILMYVDRYERYCEANPHYENNKAVRTIAYLKDLYDEHLKNNTFLKES